eukprot:6179207-Pleurochrysis_carterae.AAC.1
MVSDMYFLESGLVLRTVEIPEEDDEEDEDEDEPDEPSQHVSNHVSNHASNHAKLSRRSSEAEPPKREPERVKITSAGTPLCAAAFLYNLPQDATIEALTASSCLALQKVDYIALAKEYAVSDDKARRSRRAPAAYSAPRTRKPSSQFVKKYDDCLYAILAAQMTNSVHEIAELDTIRADVGICTWQVRTNAS